MFKPLFGLKGDLPLSVMPLSFMFAKSRQLLTEVLTNFCCKFSKFTWYSYKIGLSHNLRVSRISEIPIVTSLIVDLGLSLIDKTSSINLVSRLTTTILYLLRVNDCGISAFLLSQLSLEFSGFRQVIRSGSLLKGSQSNNYATFSSK